ncbi:MAG: substrate-binding periplasmic protein [Saccharospirillum sp.]
MLKRWMIALLALVSVAAADSLVIVGNQQGLLPYYYGDNLDRGFLVAIVREFSAATGIDSRFQPSPSNRHEWFLAHGHANAIFANPAWLPIPDQMHLVGPLFHWEDRVFAQPGLTVGDGVEQLSGTICLRSGFTYSDRLENRLGNELERFDADSDDILMRMFVRQRCDYTVMDDLEFQYLARAGDLDPALYETSIIDARWPVFLAIRKTETALIEAAEAFFTPERFVFNQAPKVTTD